MFHYEKTPNLSLIVAMATNRAIGKDNDLLWHISADLKRFKSLTSGHPVIMGRKTFLSLPKRPLPNRRNIVLTHDQEFHPEGVEVAATLRQALQLITDEEESFIIGGASIYEQFLPLANRLYVTLVDREYDADVYFPIIDQSLFVETYQSEKHIDEASGLSYQFFDYERRFGR